MAEKCDQCADIASLPLLWDVPEEPSRTPDGSQNHILGTTAAAVLNPLNQSCSKRTRPAVPHYVLHHAALVSLVLSSGDVEQIKQHEARRYLQELFLEDNVKDKLACRGRSGNASSH